MVAVQLTLADAWRGVQLRKMDSLVIPKLPITQDRLHSAAKPSAESLILGTNCSPSRRVLLRPRYSI